MHTPTYFMVLTFYETMLSQNSFNGKLWVCKYFKYVVNKYISGNGGGGVYTIMFISLNRDAEREPRSKSGINSFYGYLL